MKKLFLMILLGFTVFCMSSVAAWALPVLIDTYEVSYIYNSVASNGDQAPVGAVQYGDGIFSAPIRVGLTSGEYYLKMISGRETGGEVNKDIFDNAVTEGLDSVWDRMVLPNNPGASKYQAGFDGGNTHPSNLDNPSDYWRNWTWFWVGSSETNGVADALWSVGDTKDFSAGAGEDLWLYWTDSHINDNLGGSTVELWRTSESSAVPEPATMALFGIGLAGMALRKRFV